jgi:predicted nucleotidyltransferase
MLERCSIFKVAEVFFDEPTKAHYLVEISKKSNIAHTSVKVHLESLKKIGIMQESSEKKGKRNFPIYKADIESEEYRFYKRIDNLEKLRKSGLSGFLKDKFMPNAIVLFGSYEKGEDTEESDIDLFLGCEKKEVELARFEKMLHRKIQLHFKAKFKEYPKELKNNIINGIVIEGYLEAF